MNWRGGRSRRAMAGLVTSTAIIGVVFWSVPVLAASGPKVSLSASPKTIYYEHHVTLRGALSTKKRGVKLSLLAQPWPFSASPHSVATTKTRQHGKYAFTKKPMVATRYEVTAPSPPLHSRTRVVYVTPGYRDITCTVSGQGLKNLPCPKTAKATLPHGKYTLRFGYDSLYPRSAYATEKSKSVYIYYGQRNGSKRPPSTLGFQKKVPQHPGRGTSTRISVALQITAPKSVWSYYVLACTQLSEQTDGLGLPGPLGSHHCGDSRITIRQAKTTTLG
jgi:hypothetical protein